MFIFFNNNLWLYHKYWKVCPSVTIVLPSKVTSDLFFPLSEPVLSHSLRLVCCFFLAVVFGPQCVSPTLSPVCPYHVHLLSLSFFLQEEKGISCELVELDFLRCRVGFPFMRAQTKVAPTKVELSHVILELLSSSVSSLPMIVKWGKLQGLTSRHASSRGIFSRLWISSVTPPYYSVFFIFTVSFRSDFWHDPALWGKWHIAVLSSSKKVRSSKFYLQREIPANLNTDCAHTQSLIITFLDTLCLSAPILSTNSLTTFWTSPSLWFTRPTPL